MSDRQEILRGSIDLDTEKAVEQGRLYRLWEEGNWSSSALDFSQDIIDWREKITPRQRLAISWLVAMFLDGEEAVTRTLAPFIEAAQDYEGRIFLATQIADEARHHVFFDRFLREVTGVGTDLCSTLQEIQAQLNWCHRQLFNLLDALSDQLHCSPPITHELRNEVESLANQPKNMPS